MIFSMYYYVRIRIQKYRNCLGELLKFAMYYAQHNSSGNFHIFPITQVLAMTLFMPVKLSASANKSTLIFSFIL